MLSGFKCFLGGCFFLFSVVCFFVVFCLFFLVSSFFEVLGMFFRTETGFFEAYLDWFLRLGKFRPTYLE